MSTVIQTPAFIRSIPDPVISQEISDSFYQLLDKDYLASEIRANLIQLKLDARHGEIQSPLALFENAKSALDRPTSTIDAPVPMTFQLRACIDLIIDQLLKRRRDQEPTDKTYQGKICSIGNQCGRDGLESAHFYELGRNATLIMNELLGTKDK